MEKNKKNSLQAVLDNKVVDNDSGNDVGTIEKPLRNKYFRKSRDGKKLIAGHFDLKIAKQLKLIAVDEDTTIQALLEEAVDLLLIKKGIKMKK